MSANSVSQTIQSDSLRKRAGQHLTRADREANRGNAKAARLEYAAAAMLYREADALDGAQ